MIHYKIRNRYYHIRYRIKYWYYKMIEIIKTVISPKQNIKPEDAIIITKIEWKDLPFEKFTFRVKLNGSEYGYGRLNIPDKVNDGHYRKNMFYGCNCDDNIISLYVSRLDGYYKIDKIEMWSTVKFYNTYYKDRVMVNRIEIKLIRTAHNYRHKPLQDLLDVVIAQEELELL